MVLLRTTPILRVNTNFDQGDWYLSDGKVDYGQTEEEALAAEQAEELPVWLQEATLFFHQNSLPACTDLNGIMKKWPQLLPWSSFPKEDKKKDRGTVASHPCN